RAPGFLLGNQRDGAVEADLEHVFRRIQRGIDAGMGDVGPEAAEVRGDRLVIFRMQADFTRQREQLDRHGEVHLALVGALGDAAALRLFAFTQLHIGAEAAGAQADLFFRTRINTQLDGAGIAFARLGADLAGELAVRIVGAADKGAKAAQLQVQAAIFAGRTFARVDARLAVRKDVPRKN